VRKGSVGAKARQTALRAVREALERGEVPVEAPELMQGDYGEFWVAPDGKVYVRSEEALSPERARAERIVEVELVVVPGGRAAAEEPGEERAGPQWRGTILWNDDLSRLAHWRAADGSWLVIDEL
jgi:hypothetical protein